MNRPTRLAPSARALVLVAALAALAAGRAAAAETREAAATRAARQWLALVDQGQYERSWTEAAALFRGAIPQAQWAQQVGGVRRPLGTLRTRTVASASHRTSLPGAPDGDYVVLLFETSFSGRAAAQETVTAMLEPGGWRVAGYFVR